MVILRFLLSEYYAPGSNLTDMILLQQCSFGYPTLEQRVLHLRKKPSGRPLTITTPENVARVRASIQQSPRRSAVKHAAALGLSDRSVIRILHRDLHMHPYKMIITQKLSERDFKSRRAVCEDILQNIPAGNVFISSDEAYFHLSDTVNKQHFRY